MSYPRPRDENNYRKHIKLEDNRALVFCVECDYWHQIELQATGFVRIRAWMEHPQLVEIDSETPTTLVCGECGVSIEYLVEAFRAMVVNHIMGEYFQKVRVPVVVKPKKRFVQKRFEYV